jgi:DNA-binding transcriptional regulator LsrR (DeoR family)
MSHRTHRGSDLRDFLKEEGVLEEVEAHALKRAIALQLERLRKEQAMSKSTLAKRMNTSRAAVDRLLDASNPSSTLITIEKAARVFKRKLKVELVPA